MTSAPELVNLRDQPIRRCLACGYGNGIQRGRELHCPACEVVYLIPAVQLAASIRNRRSA